MRLKKRFKKRLAVTWILVSLINNLAAPLWVTAQENQASQSAQQEIVTPAPTPSPEVTPTTVLLGPTLTPPSTPTTEPSLTLAPTLTATPTATPSPTLTLMPTEAPTSVPLILTPEASTIVVTAVPIISPVISPSSLWGSIKGLFDNKDLKENKPKITKANFRSNESVEVVLGDYQDKQLSVSLFRGEGLIENIEVKIENGNLKISPPRNFKPGKYTIKISTNDTKDGLVEQDFTWGVLAINSNKSVYLPDEKAYLQMASLDENGHTVCNSSLKLEIRSPDGEAEILTTQDGTINNLGTCGADNVTDIPDYFVYFETKEIGTYQLKLTNLDNGYEIEDFFEVKKKVAFDIERVSATRINPFKASYKMNFKIKANKNFAGEVTESIPDSFEVKSQISNIKNTTQNSKTLVWDVDWKQGESYELSYEYDAPDISPQFYLLGPLIFRNEKVDLNVTNLEVREAIEDVVGSGKIIFQEARQWQIAADAANDVILLWDTDKGEVPNGWTCISCGTTAAFYGVFPMAGSVYGDTAGSDTHNNHSFTLPSQTVGSSSPALGATGGSKGILSTHQHTWTGPTIGQGDVRPPFKNLNLIKASSPSDVPANAIVMFDTASLAVGWTRYSALDGRYLRGNDDNITGGTEAHTHTISVTSSTYALDMTDTGGIDDSAAAHYHTLSSLTSSNNNQPPYVNVVFAYKGGNTSLPDGMLAFFDTTPPANWTNVGTSAPYLNKFLVGASSGIGDTGGSSATHNHNGTVTVTSTSGGGTGLPNIGGTTGGYRLALAPHTHNVTYTVGSSADYLPRYRTVILAKYLVSRISVSGNIYTNETGTAYNCSGGNSKTVRVKVNGSESFSGTCTGVDGAFTVSNVVVSAAGDVLTVYIDGGSPVFATTVTKIADTTSSINNLPLYQNRILLSHQNGGPVTNANIDKYDSIGDPDIQFTSNGVGLTVNSGNKIVIASGKNYTSGGEIQTPAIGVGGTFTPEGNTVTLLGSGTGTTCTDEAGTVMPLCLNSGTFNPGTSTINFAAPAANTTLAATNYYNLGVGTSADIGVGATYILGGNMGVGGTFTVGNALSTNSDILNGSSYTLTLSGSGTPFNMTAKGSFLGSSSTVNYLGTSATTIAGVTYNNVGVGTSAESGSGVTYTLGGNVGVGGTFTVGNASSTNIDTVAGSSYTLTFSGAGTPFNITGKGAFSGGTSTVKYTGQETTNINGITFNNLQLAPAGGTPTFNLGLGAGQTVAASGSVTIGDGSSPVTVSTSTYNPIVNVTGNLSVGSSATLSGSGTGTITVNGNVTGTGAINLTAGNFEQRASANVGIGTTAGSNNWTFNNLTLSNASVSNGVGTTIGGSSVNINNDSDFGPLPGAGRQIVRTSAGTIYAVLDDGNVLEVWSSTDGSTWQQRDSDHSPAISSNNVAIDIDSNDKIHIIFQKEVLSSDYVHYIVFDTSSNLFEGSPTNISINYPLDYAIAVDSNNAPHVVVNQNTVGNMFIYYKNKVGESWNGTVTIEDLGFTILGDNGVDIIINEDDVPEIVYINPNDNALTAAVGNGNNATSFGTPYDVDTSVNNTDNQRGCSIGVDAAGNTWIAYTNSTGYLALAWENDSLSGYDDWTTDISNAANNVGYEPSIVVQGSSIYAFYENDAADIAYDKYAGTWKGETVVETGTYHDVKAKWSSLNWNQPAQVDFLFSDGIDVFWHGINIDLTVDDASNFGAMAGDSRQVVRTSSGTLYSALAVGGTVEIWKSTDGSSWIRQDAADGPACDTSSNVSAAIDGSNVINIAYFDSSDDFQLVKFDTSTDSFGSPDPIYATAGALGIVISLDDDDKPHVVFNYAAGSPSWTYRYTNKVGANWRESVLFTGNEGGMGFDITINDENKPEVVYSLGANIIAKLGNANDASSFEEGFVDTSGVLSNSLVSIGIDSLGNTWIGYMDSDNHVNLAKHLDTSNWDTDWTVDISNSANNVGYEPSLAINGSDIYVFYENGTDDIVYDKYDGSDWLGETPLETGTYQDVKARWSYRNNASYSTYGIDYLYSDNSDIYWNNVTLGGSATPITITANSGGGGSIGIGGTFQIGRTTDNAATTFDNNTNDRILDIDNDVEVSSQGVLSSSSTSSFTIGGNFSNNGTFTANSGTVTFDSAKTSNIYFGGTGSTQPFYNLFITTAGKAVQFDETDQVGVGGSFYVQGSNCTSGRVFLDSTTNDNPWDINVTGTADVDYADIEDSNAIIALTANSSSDGGGNSGWTINTCAASSTSSSATAYPFQRKTWYDGTRYWKSFNANSRIEFWYSLNGTAWTENTDARIAVDTNDFSIEADSSNTFIAYTNGYDIEARKAGSIGVGYSWGSATIVYDGSSSTDAYSYPSISKGSNNKVWVTTRHYTNDTLTLQPDATDGYDGYIKAAFSPNERNGTATYETGAPYLIHSETAADWQVRSMLVKFDLSTLAGATINSAKLYFYESLADYPNQGIGYAYRILPANIGWVEDASYNNPTADTSGYWAGDTGNDGGTDAGCSISGTDFDATPVFTGDNEPDTAKPVGYEFEHTADTTEFTEMVNDNHGLIVSGTWQRNYASSDHATAGYRPKLVVEYSSYNFLSIKSSSADDISSWGAGATLDASANINKYGAIIPVGVASSANMYAVWIDGTTVEGKKYVGVGVTGWGSADSIGTGLTGMANSLSLVGGTGSIGANLIYVGAGGSAVYQRYTDSWQTAVALDTNSGNEYPSISVDNAGGSGIYAFWTRDNDIFYKRACSDYTSWGDIQTLEDTGTNNWLTTGYSTFGSGKIFGQRTSGTESPYTISWESITPTACGGAENQGPNSPTSLVQMKIDNSIIGAGTWINSTSISIGATASDPDASDSLFLCVENKVLGVGFTNVEDNCGVGVSYSGTAVGVGVTITGLSDNTQYHWQVKAKDGAGVGSSWVAFGGGVTRDFGVDTSAPSGGLVYDGLDPDVDKTFNDGSLSSLSANWSGVNADVSGLNYYEYSIGTGIGATGVKNWTNIGTGTSAVAIGLTLQTSTMYYFNVRATDNAGNVQSPISSNGQKISPSLTFSVSPSTLTFDNLNIGNSFSSTKQATLTTSTNAYGGYIIKTFATDYLRSAGVGYTIPDFNGGTYVSPAVWGEGNIGFGYTSSDATIQGLNKFGVGIGGTLYAPISQTGPGDIVADYTDNVLGSPITDDQYTITYKVKTGGTQQAANYSSTVVYTVTAIY